MDLRQLAAVIAVAEHGSFSAAARALHTVQSNVSTHVAKLESEVGATLIDRSSCRLTAEGEAVVARARRVQAELDALDADLASMRDEVQGSVRLGVIGSTARWLAGHVLRELGELHPRIQIVLLEASTTSLLPAIAEGSLDLAVVNLPVTDPDVDTEPLFVEDLVLVVPDGHELSGRESVGMADLAGIPLLRPALGTALRAEIDEAALRAGVELTGAAEIDGIRLLASLAFAGFAAALLPATATPVGLVGPWQRVTVTDTARRHVGLARRRRGLLSAPARAVRNVVVDVVGAHHVEQPGVGLPG